jgi:uncharacterized membrane protein
MARNRNRLDQPRTHRQLVPRPSYDPDAFGRLSESVARFFGTARYLAIQSVFVVAWIVWNVLIITKHVRFDPYPFILLNLMFSTQAAYAAPLILLAQNRQALRDKVQAQQDRSRDERQTAETEFMAREMASLRIALGEVATRDFVRAELQRLLEEINGRDGEVETEGVPRPSREGRS